MSRWTTPSRLTLLLLAGTVLTIAAWLWWLGARQPDIRFLSSQGPADWITYPTPPTPFKQPAVERRVTFRRAFSLDRPPLDAPVQVRAFSRFQLAVNGMPVELPGKPGQDWKQLRGGDVARNLHRGGNEIAVTVTNSNGPPALWLSLAGSGLDVHTDEQWEATLFGAVPRPARLAALSWAESGGNPGHEAEQSFPSFLSRWHTLALFGALSALVVAVLFWWQSRRAPDQPLPRSFSPRWLIGGLSGLWLLLFFNNLGSLPHHLGFDYRHHLKYIEYIQERLSLPLADEGWEMHQPPLYYGIAAVLSSVGHLARGDLLTVALLRFLSVAAGIAQVVLVLASLRLLFPGQWRRQGFGLVLAAFVPVHLYMAQYVTNDMVAAALASGAVYLCLRILHEEHASARWYASLGISLGAALLAKVTTIVVVPIVVAVLAGRLVVQRQRDPRVWLRTLGVTLLACLVTCGWHFGRVLVHFGSPLVGSYDPASGFTWWQDPGYSMTSYFSRFGQSLTEPFFSVFNGFFDGIYSTLWGDGLWGGPALPAQRPPWDYELMAAGYLLALLPTVAILVGTAVAVVQLVHQPRAEWFLLLGLALCAGLAQVYHFARLPYFCHVKAFYGLPAMVALCGLGAWGLDALCRVGRGMGVVLSIVLGTWAMASFASFWVPGDSADAQAWQGVKKLNDGKFPGSVVHFHLALERDPRHLNARLGLAEALALLGQDETARESYQQAVEDHPDQAAAHFGLALAWAREKHLDQAVEEFRRTLELAPDHPKAYFHLAQVLMLQDQTEAAIQAFRHALGNLPTSAETYHRLALALIKQEKVEEAIDCEYAALELQPNSPEVLQSLAQACARANRWKEAEEALRRAVKVALASGQDKLIPGLQRQLQIVQTRRLARG